MRWIKQIKPVTLHQASDLPYVITKEGVYLCFDNFYSESKFNGNHVISFRINREQLSRKSSTYYKISSFPITIPFENVIKLNETIINGRIIKHVSEINDTKNIMIIKASYLCNLSDNRFQDLVSNIEEHDKSFLLIEEPIDPQVRLLDTLVYAITHNIKQSWNRTCVTIADVMCSVPHRKYCWTNSVPGLKIQCYGLSGVNDEMYDLQKCLEDIGIDFDVTWEE